MGWSREGGRIHPVRKRAMKKGKPKDRVSEAAGLEDRAGTGLPLPRGGGKADLIRTSLPSPGSSSKPFQPPNPERRRPSCSDGQLGQAVPSAARPWGSGGASPGQDDSSEDGEDGDTPTPTGSIGVPSIAATRLDRAFIDARENSGGARGNPAESYLARSAPHVRRPAAAAISRRESNLLARVT